MPLETGIDDNSTPDDLNQNWPLGSDPKSEGDDHIRNLKQVLQNVYDQLNFVNLPPGTVPGLFGREFDVSGITVVDGGLEVRFPMDITQGFVSDPVTNLFCPLPFTPVGGDQPPKHYRTQDAAILNIQPDDTQVNTQPIQFTFSPGSNELVFEILVRGAGTTIPNVRAALRKGSSTGPLVLRTASDQELRDGGGFTIEATGDTILTLPQYWAVNQADTFFISLDRYDAVTDSIVTDGIFLKGATVGQQFIPYFDINGYQYTLVELQEKSAQGGELIEEIAEEEDKTPRVVGIDTELSTIVNVTLLENVKYRWDVYILASFISGTDPRANIDLLVDGVPIDDTGGGSIGQVASRSSGRIMPFTFSGRITEPTTQIRAFTLNADLESGSVTILKTILTISRGG